ncbi:MAG TPA: succinate dehydrogenase cytochrome b subunit [Labilithrix sp.]|nr:succinate dehydrogenase cytochrome b subunit [Labilithrix sp.]
MSRFAKLLRSTIGEKIVMASTGLVGAAFVVAHAAGNLQAFVGREKLNAYGALLHGPLAELLWIARLVLVAAVTLHVAMAFWLSARSNAARPVSYAKLHAQAATVSSRTMLVGGVLLLAFIVFHVLHFTTGTIDPAGVADARDAAGRRDVYGNLVASFHIGWVAILYIASMLVLGMHLAHGLWSAPRTLGCAESLPNPRRRPVAMGIAVAVWLAFTLVPVGVLVGLIR